MVVLGKLGEVGQVCDLAGGVVDEEPAGGFLEIVVDKKKANRFEIEDKIEFLMRARPWPDAVYEGEAVSVFELEG